MPALADVGAVRLFAHGVQSQLAHQALDADVVVGARRPDLQPLRLLVLRQRRGPDVTATDELEGNCAHCAVVLLCCCAVVLLCCCAVPESTSARQHASTSAPLSILGPMATLQITWLGHSAFRIVTPAGTRILTDPWLGNPSCPAHLSKPEALLPIDLILLSHGHGDHLGDTVQMARAGNTPVVCLFELGQYLTAKGVQRVHDMAKG